MRSDTLVVMLLLIITTGCDFNMLSSEHVVRVGQYPKDWEDFKEGMHEPLIQIPEEAKIVSLMLGEGNMGCSIDITFTLPDSKSPPQWLYIIATQSGNPNRIPHSLQPGQWVEVKYYDAIPINEAKEKAWAIGFHGNWLNNGRLRYKNGKYNYFWTND